MREAISDNAIRERSNPRDGGMARRAIRKNTRQLRDLGNPAVIRFAINFYSEAHKNGRIGLVANRTSTDLLPQY